LLIRQSLAVRDNPSPATGAALVYENANLLGISTDVPERVSGFQRDNAQTLGQATAQVKGSKSDGNGLPEMVARTLLERGEQWGVNRTVMSAVSELRVRAILRSG
jgi:TBC1 domain family protein 5